MRDRIYKRLGNFELLPDEALPAVEWAFEMVQANRMTQLGLYEELTAKFSELELKIPSFSSFNRWAQRVRAGQIQRPGTRKSSTSSPWPISASTSVLLAAALRAVADDLDGVCK